MPTSIPRARLVLRAVLVFPLLVPSVVEAGNCGAVFFFQAEDGIRDADVTGVQTCALPIYLDEHANLAAHVYVGADRALGGDATRLLRGRRHAALAKDFDGLLLVALGLLERTLEIGRASCRERVWLSVGVDSFKENDGIGFV